MRLNERTIGYTRIHVQYVAVSVKDFGDISGKLTNRIKTQIWVHGSCMYS